MIIENEGYRVLIHLNWVNGRPLHWLLQVLFKSYWSEMPRVDGELILLRDEDDALVFRGFSVHARSDSEA